MNFKEFKKIGSYYNLDITEELYSKLEIYAEYLVEYNKKVNLTAITEHREIYIKHFLDSLIPLIYVDIPLNSTLIDVGTGAGFPSIPMKLYRPDIKLTLLDSLNKRIVFLESLCSRLNIDAECIHGRAEDFGKDVCYREKFDFATARAVANLQVLSEYCIPFVKVGGSFIAMKGLSEDINSSNNAIKILGAKIINDINYTIPPEDNRRIVVIEKVCNTPKKYPRISGKIKSKPL
ncbi:MAG: 16S rRNA (guanine(527)-N(7))-methyltransferase RsmG [Ruminococcus sp.]|nr:16S rRNA (guanine(527)-N(7))-methyltransferase RsmG [Ruminococcus sp.]